MNSYEIKPGTPGCRCSTPDPGFASASTSQNLTENFEIAPAHRFTIPHLSPALSRVDFEATLPEPIYQGPAGPKGSALPNPWSVSMETVQCRKLNDDLKFHARIFFAEQQRLENLADELRVLDIYRDAPPGTPPYFPLEDPCDSLNEQASILTTMLGNPPNPELAALRDQLNVAYNNCAAYLQGRSAQGNREGFIAAIEYQRGVLLRRIAVQTEHTRAASRNYLQALALYLSGCGLPGIFRTPW